VAPVTKTRIKKLQVNCWSRYLGVLSIPVK
jgi:hypothetical protein